MVLIHETGNFVVEAFDTPHVTRTDGGHIKIYPKERILSRTDMSPSLATEFIRLTMVVGKALEIGMKKRGIDIIRVNYHDMGNWAFKKGKRPYFHIHVYGRASNAKYQPSQEAVRLPDRSSGFYDNFEPLNGGDISEIRRQIKSILLEEKYKDASWGPLLK
jgi:diadenosine tetraphosphate (Ap4A) HIT family hydrolase